ncbi:hypothetical protein J3R30DRAFT_3700239 [Lentinula aciculospora]|uniref:N-acetyltransferase domain-containing protein n=1 Tax=Lentinula aciculospora TaxID=153920 RepID=A0A9W9AEP6_9AGAR|nr:hypothetical protein J3R30DRAFT_3700239 [Lentinula aciculospora]
MIREALPDDLDVIGWAAAEAFIADAMAHYFSGTTKLMSITNKSELRELYDLYHFVTKTCMISGGRVILAVPMESNLESSSETSSTIAAAACWYPPRKRVTTLNAVRGGITKCIRNWRVKGFERMLTEYSPKTHELFKRAFTSKAMETQRMEKGKQDKKRILRESDSWYLQLMFSSKQYEGRGLMSTLMREGFAYAHSSTPGIPFTLDATSARARDRYLHLGYELMEPETLIGVGKANAQGIAPVKKYRDKNEELTGVPYWCMVNVRIMVPLDL